VDISLYLGQELMTMKKTGKWKQQVLLAALNKVVLLEMDEVLVSSGVYW